MNQKQFASAQANYEAIAPPEAIDLDELTTEQLCDKIAENWVKAGGDVTMFLGTMETIALMIDAHIECVEMRTEMAETWWMAGGDVELFRNHALDIKGWIAAHMAAYGRK